MRHAQGVHNTVVGKGPEALLSQELFDAQLSDLGFKQVNQIIILYNNNNNNNNKIMMLPHNFTDGVNDCDFVLGGKIADGS